MALLPGSIAFIGFNADGNDSLAFVALATLPAGTTIFFSDREWTGSAFNSSEGGWSWTAPATDVAAGTVITISDISDQDGVPISANIGTAAGGSGLGADNEIVYAYVGPDANTPTAFLTAVANDTFTVDGGTLAGTGLTVGVDALQFSGIDADTDVAAFNGSRGDQADFSAYAAVINNPANWITQDGTGDQSADGVAPDVPFSTESFTIGGAGNEIGGIAILDQAASLQGSVAAPVATNALTVSRLGSWLSGDGEGGSESLAFDATTDRAYVTNAAAERIDILDLADAAHPTKVGEIDLASLPAYGNVNSVAVRDGLVAVAVQNVDGGEAGLVALYDGAGTLIKTITVGVLPDQVTFSPDGNLLLVANEAERFLDRSGPAPVVEDAAGTITIIDVSGDPAAAAVRNTIGFSALDGDEAALDALGLKTYDGGTLETDEDDIVVPDSAVSQDIEPEYITVSPDGTRAYVTLQEVNAIAVIDLTDPTADRPLSILPAGAVDFSLARQRGRFLRPRRRRRHGVDLGRQRAGQGTAAARRDRLVRRGRRDLLRHRQRRRQPHPAGCHAGRSGPQRSPGWQRAVRRLGRLCPRQRRHGVVDPVRSLFLRRPRLLDLQAERRRHHRQGEETGGDFEQILAPLPNAATVFNGENGGGFDTRSDNKGPEPEGVAVGTVDGTPYVFVALERIGGVMVWDVSTPSDAKFVQLPAADIGRFRSRGHQVRRAAESPTGRAMLIAANEISGSITTYDIAVAGPSTISISTIQGTGHVSALDGQTVTTEGVVTAVDTNGSRLLHPGSQRRRQCRHLGRHLRVHQRSAHGDGRPARARDRRGRRVRGQRRGAGQLLDHRDRGDDRRGRRDRRAGHRPGHQATVIGGAGGLLPPSSSLADGLRLLRKPGGHAGHGEGRGGRRSDQRLRRDLHRRGQRRRPCQRRQRHRAQRPRRSSPARAVPPISATSTSPAATSIPSGIQIDDDSGVRRLSSRPASPMARSSAMSPASCSYDFGNYEIVPTQAYAVDQAEHAGEGDHDAGRRRQSADGRELQRREPRSVRRGGALHHHRPARSSTDLKLPDIIALQEVQDNDGAGQRRRLDGHVGFRDPADAGRCPERRGAGRRRIRLHRQPVHRRRPQWRRAAAATSAPPSSIAPTGSISSTVRSRTHRRRTARPITDPAGNADQQTNPDNPFFDSRPPLVATFDVQRRGRHDRQQPLHVEGRQRRAVRLRRARRSTPAKSSARRRRRR